MTEDVEKKTGPHNAIVILLDSLNRHMLGAHGSAEFATPNLDRFAARSRIRGKVADSAAGPRRTRQPVRQAGALKRGER